MCTVMPHGHICSSLTVLSRDERQHQVPQKDHRQHHCVRMHRRGLGREYQGLGRTNVGGGEIVY